MKSMILIAFVLMSSALSAQAAGVQEASEICTSMSFDSGRQACVTAIKNFDYYDRAAIKICKGLSFDSGRQACITAIGDKAYEQFEIDLCGSQSFDSGKLTCLTTNGKTFRRGPPAPRQLRCYSTGDLIQKLQDIDSLVWNGQNRSARIELNYLMAELTRCN